MVGSLVGEAPKPPLQRIVTNEIPPHAGEGRLWKLIHKLAERIEPELTATFLGALEHVRSFLREDTIRSALLGKNLVDIEAGLSALSVQEIWAPVSEVGPSGRQITRLARLLGLNERDIPAALSKRAASDFIRLAAGGQVDPQAVRQLLQDVRMGRTLSATLLRVVAVGGDASAGLLSEAMGLAVSFNVVNPNVVLYARQQAARLVAGVGDDVREMIRTVVVRGQEQGIPINQQSRMIMEMVGLPPNQVDAAFNFAEELRAGKVNSRRLLHNPMASQSSQVSQQTRMVKQLRSRVAAGTIDEAFVLTQQERYTQNLIRRRALTIARTEALDALNAGAQESWMQAIDEGVLPPDIRRFWIVTPDDRLEHWMVPGNNPDGRGMTELFDTPEGWVLRPPSRASCRCGISLMLKPGVML